MVHPRTVLPALRRRDFVIAVAAVAAGMCVAPEVARAESRRASQPVTVRRPPDRPPGQRK